MSLSILTKSLDLTEPERVVWLVTYLVRVGKKEYKLLGRGTVERCSHRLKGKGSKEKNTGITLFAYQITFFCWDERFVCQLVGLIKQTS
jgi:hypothetical protein